jgi:hypothetical protein
MHGWLAPGVSGVEAPFSPAARDTMSALFEAAFVDSNDDGSDSPAVRLGSGLTAFQPPKHAFAMFDVEDETEHNLTFGETAPLHENVDRLFAEDFDSLVDQLMLVG